jgi:DNA-binding NarL/FixJ family response regulator
LIVEDGTDDALLIAREQQRIGQGEQPPSLLTRCQREILQFVAEGRSTEDIARKLNLSAKTVEPHRSQLM